LAACATGDSEALTVVCLPVVPYDQAILDRAADELETLPTDAAVVRMLSDYAVMRAQARACQRAGE